jgi:hypothetical protein
MYRLCFNVTPTDDALDFYCKLDDVLIWSGNITDSQQVEIPFDDSNYEEHRVELVLQGKNSQHTTLDQHGNVVRDSMLIISQVYMDDLVLDYLFYRNCEYVHDNNGATPMTSHSFWGSMGCNGAVIFRWQSPFYLWYLQEKNQ